MICFLWSKNLFLTLSRYIFHGSHISLFTSFELIFLFFLILNVLNYVVLQSESWYILSIINCLDHTFLLLSKLKRLEFDISDHEVATSNKDTFLATGLSSKLEHCADHFLFTGSGVSLLLDLSSHFNQICTLIGKTLNRIIKRGYWRSYKICFQ